MIERWSDLSPERRRYLEWRRANVDNLLDEIYRLELAEREFPVTPETHRLVFSFPDGRVGVTQPTHEALYFMTGRGGYWDGRPPGFLPELIRRKTCQIMQRGRACTREAATNFVKAMQWGGRSWMEAWTILGQHDCARLGGRVIEIQHINELPPTREHRDAWRRSANGGPIYVDDALAMAIDEKRQREAA